MTLPRTPTKQYESEMSFEDEAIEQQRKRLRSSVNNCFICKNMCDIDNMIQCKTCSKLMHYICLGMSETFFKFFILQKQKPWECDICTRRNIDEIKMNTTQIIKNMQELKNDQQALYNELNTCKKKLNLYDQQINAISSTVVESSKTNDEKLNSIKEKINQNQDSVLAEICYMQGETIQNELVISGIPKVQGENLQHIMNDICRALGVAINISEISKTHRLGQEHTQNQQKRNQPIVYKFTTTIIRNKIYEKYIEIIKNKRHINLAAIGIQQEGRIYINPRVPKCLSDVYKKALEYKRKGLLKAVNPRVNNITINIKEEWIKIHTINQLERAINQR